MLKMEIVLKKDIVDEEQINNMYTMINKLFEDTNIDIIETGMYSGYDNGDDEISGDLFDFLTIMAVLSETDWFREYVSVWNWYEDESIENLIKTFEIN